MESIKQGVSMSIFFFLFAFCNDFFCLVRYNKMDRHPVGAAEVMQMEDSAGTEQTSLPVTMKRIELNE